MAADDTASPDASGPAELDADERVALEGPIRRNKWLLLVVAGFFALSILLTRVLDSYRGIVLLVDSDEMLVAFERVSPAWMAAIGVEPGQLVEKTAGTWSPVPVERQAGDDKLVAMWERYSDVYEGTIVQITPRQNHGDPQPVVIETTDGRRIDWTDLMAETKVGQKVVKEAGTWDPVVVTKAPSP